MTLATSVETPAAPLIEAPLAPRRPRTDVYHGETRLDDYFWLRDKSDPAVTAYLEAENAYAEAVMAPTVPVQEALYREMLSHIKETDLSVPYREGAYFYYSRTEQGLQYSIYCRKRGGLNAPEEVVLDLNALAEGHSYLSLGAYHVSDNGRLLAYSLDTTGFREYTLYVNDLETGRLIGEPIERTGSVAWAADNETLFYTVEDAAKRAYRLYRHRIGSSAHNLVFEENDELFRVGVGRTRSRRFVLLVSGSLTTTEWSYLEASDPAGAFRVITPREHEHEYEVDHHGDSLYIRTNDAGRNFRLVTTSVADPGRQSWHEVVPHRSNVMLEGLECFKGHYVLLERENGLPQIRITEMGDVGASHRIAFPEPAYSVFPAANPEWDTRFLRYSYQSLVTPSSVYDYDLQTRESVLLKRTEVPGGFEPESYVSERLHATAADGARVPVSLVYRRDKRGSGPSPMLLTGYGSYGFPFPVSFSASRLALLDRGIAFAIAHIRGGAEMGKPWHDDGRMMKKMNTFTDFIAVTEHLIAEGYTAPDRLAIEGGSAGGLLMGTVVNMRSDLFRAVVSKVPFVDVINTMMDASLPLTAGEWEEWGDPRKKEEYDYIRRYCPYSNLVARPYPPMLVKTSLNDSQVMFWEPAKYVAKMRALRTDDNVLLLKTNMNAGHGGASGRYDYLREIALDYAFVLAQLAIDS